MYRKRFASSKEVVVNIEEPQDKGIAKNVIASIEKYKNELIDDYQNLQDLGTKKAVFVFLISMVLIFPVWVVDYFGYLNQLLKIKTIVDVGTEILVIVIPPACFDKYRCRWFQVIIILLSRSIMMSPYSYRPLVTIVVCVLFRNKIFAL